MTFTSLEEKLLAVGSAVEMLEVADFLSGAERERRTLELVLPAFSGMIATLRFHADRMAELAPQGFSLATDVAEWLVRQGVAFRDAHEISGALVRACEDREIGLEDADDALLASVSPALTPAVREVLTIEGSVASRSGVGGTSPVRVGEQREELVVRAQAAARALVS